ncbi:MAG TPA: SRPBCC family protein [Gaiellaceae bacterium]|nr:SRPBCC family protein [Gaiellaceae bacterium]
MVRIEGEIDIGRPVDEVFDLVADERNEPRYNPRMLRAEKISPGPIGVGTRFRAEFKSWGRPVARSEITGYERPRMLASATHMSMMEVRGTLTFDRIPEGTRMRWSWELDLRGVFRLMGPLVARIGRRQEQATWASLKRHLEQQATPPPQN